MPNPWLASGKNVKHGDLRRDRLELFEGRILVYRYVRPGSRRPLQAGLQYRRAFLDRQLFEPHLLGTSVVQDRIAGRYLVPNPCHVCTEHRDEVSLSLENSHHEREGNRASGAAACHLQRNEIVRCNATSVHGCPPSIQQPGQRIGTVPSVEPTLEPSERQAIPLVPRGSHSTAALAAAG